jgi:hypothetical protein
MEQSRIAGRQQQSLDAGICDGFRGVNIWPLFDGPLGRLHGGNT